MKPSLSRLRTRKTRERERQAARSRERPLLQRPVFGVLIGIALWLLSTVLIGPGAVFGPGWSSELLLPLSASAVLLLASLCAGALFLRICRPDILDSNASVLHLAAASLLALGISRSLLYLFVTLLHLPDAVAGFGLPYALAPLLAALLLGGEAGLVTGLWTSLAMGIMAGGQLPFVTCGVVATAMTASLAGPARARARVVRIGILTGLAQVVVLYAHAAGSAEAADPAMVVQNAAACLLGGFLSSVVTLLIVPLFETASGLTTSLTLLDLSDMGHPLLQRLAIEAPGTYHHSLVVANLASAAADTIGANSLLARVGAYFHDVGKLTKPGFFTENQNRLGNPHDDLSPSMSTLIITSHVKEGLSLALRHKLPPVVCRVIHEHHGTCLLHCFHHKAKAQLELELDGGAAAGSVRINDGDFRYPGPKPSTKESAIICIADAVEAASRSLEKVTPSHIEGLVNDISFARLADGQLDASPLSFRELTLVKRSLVFSLSSMLHGRVPYPTHETEDSEQAEAGTAKRVGT